MKDVKKIGINVKLIGTVESCADRYGKMHIVVLYKYKDTILAWPTIGSSAYYTPILNKSFKITFNELSNEFLSEKKIVKRISYVKTLLGGQNEKK